ncbi:MAG: helix-turn-helix domain-containing protein [Comamonas sp.]|jgi:AraC-like DNA-binding protein|uniref:helix-turn-helix domain-containing protein n=1 Tax=Comamonas sp. TaxID=34028 RepID=UPI00282EAD7C|nr:helix-turn-helix domain-containing protein [Comamonas sp.]MDR0216597.1 helix-turn-helix domain-containing protein [Comamonas sp.]
MMSRAPINPEALLEQLEALASCKLAGECLHIKAQMPHTVKSMDIERPTFGLVLHGSKCISCADQAVQLQAGDVFLITGRCLVDAFNAPDVRNGRFLVITLNLCDEVLSAARILWAQPLRRDNAQIIGLPIEAMAESLLHWSQALHQGHYEQARVALVQMVVWLCRQGYHSLLAPPPERLSDRVHALIASAPARRWLSRDFEQALSLSGASLRRRLSSEGTSLSQVLLNARMGHALKLLSTTSLPIKTVATRVGYRSSQSFTRQFSARYQLQPADIGNQ